MNHSIESNLTDTMNDTNIPNNFAVGITAIIGGVSLVSIALIVIFTPENLSIAPWIIGSLSIMRVALGYFSSKNS
ncbi:MAG: hypothetical protein P8L44_21860 [Opitutales bacterium]|nr:hypothetical protein [Opitutales bacterium]